MTTKLRAPLSSRDVAKYLFERAPGHATPRLREGSSDQQLVDRPDSTGVTSISTSQVRAATAATNQPSTAKRKRKPSRTEWRKMRRSLQLHKPRTKRWLCCGPVERRRTRKGKQVWGAVCRYRMIGRGAATRSMWISLSYDPERPAAVIKGRKMKRCKNVPVQPKERKTSVPAGMKGK